MKHADDQRFKFKKCIQNSNLHKVRNFKFSGTFCSICSKIHRFSFELNDMGHGAYSIPSFGKLCMNEFLFSFILVLTNSVYRVTM